MKSPVPLQILEIPAGSPRARILALLVVATTLACIPARIANAQQAPASAPQTPAVLSQTEIDKKWDEGIRLAKQGDFAGAADAFREAYAASREPRMLLNLALAEKSAGRYGTALRLFREYLRTPQASPEKAASVERDIIPGLLPKAGHLVFDAPESSEVLVAARPGATFSVRAGDEVDVDPGEYELAAVRAFNGQISTRTTVRVAAGETVRVSLTFPTPTPERASPPPPAREEHAAAPAGEAKVSRARTWTVVGIGVAAVAAAGAGVYFTVSANDEKSQVDVLRDRIATTSGGCGNITSADCAELDAHVSTWFGAKDGAYWSYGIAGGLVAVGVATWLLWPRPRPASGGAWLVPTLGTDRAGLNLGGAF